MAWVWLQASERRDRRRARRHNLWTHWRWWLVSLPQCCQSSGSVLSPPPAVSPSWGDWCWWPGWWLGAETTLVPGSAVSWTRPRRTSPPVWPACPSTWESLTTLPWSSWRILHQVLVSPSCEDFSFLDLSETPDNNEAWSTWQSHLTIQKKLFNENVQY